MSLLTRLLSRFPATSARARANVDAAALQAQIDKTINDAMVAAGLAPKSTLPETVVPPLPALRRTEVEEQAGQSGPLGDASTLPGTFSEHSFVHATGKRRYKLYVPATYSADLTTPCPLLVMLHGCTQSPDDFAAGTRMNELAEQHGFLVVYPAQSANANRSRCWNWFRPGDQTRENGEPALLAALAQDIVLAFAVDPKRVYVAGLSAGAAMAVILGATYPDVFAAVGAHSGLPYRAAHDVPTAFAAMGGSHASLDSADGMHTRGLPSLTALIVFQGDADRTVAPSNADTLVRQAVQAVASLSADVSEGQSTGRGYTRTIYTTAQGDPLVEFWQIHGAGHAWSGGSPNGTYTDTRGPDASAEMVRFFLQASLVTGR